MQNNSSYPQSPPSFYKQNINNVRSSQIFYNIADQDMTEFFMDYINQQNSTNKNSNNNNNNKMQKKPQTHKQSPTFSPPQQIQQQIHQQLNLAQQTQQIKIQLNSHQVVSRLEIQIKKNGLNFISVYGQIFIMLVQAQLIAEQKKQNGKLLVTNYRFVFFKGKNRKIDLPFGFISECKLNDKNYQIVTQLKYNHYWKLKIIDHKSYQHIKIFLQIYLKIQNIKSCFAFNYALKYPQFNKIKHNQIVNQFVRLGFASNKDIGVIDNTSFQLCASYPQIIYTPVKFTSKCIAKIAKFWNQNRFPVIVYQHNGSPQYFGSIWRASNLICDRTQDLKDIAKYFQSVRKNNQKLYIFDSGFKLIKRGLQQFQVNSQCQMKYLQIDSLQSIKQAYISMVQCFLISKKSFIKDVLASKWYQGVISYLKGALQISNQVLNHHNIIIKCNNGRDKSAVLSALSQIIINPFYRTFTGFSVLIQKQFLFLGHPFLNRLGLTNNKQQQCPIFIMFLDCVSQLVYSNQMCFQYNYKYLSKLSNLMYTCLFGTFITNNRKQSLDNNISTQTVPIWNQLISELTQNAYYYQKSGILEVPIKFDDIRIWKQHFWYLTTAPKQSYKIHPAAQDNLDYINLNCHKIMSQNKSLQHQISQQKKTLDALKAKIQAKLQKQNK